MGDPDDVLDLDPARDTDLLRALAHPLRMRLLGTLRRAGPATATQLAIAVGESSGLTSYHLRQLADRGLVRDVPGRGTGRERYWQAAHRMTRFTAAAGPAGDPEGAGAEYLRSVAQAHADALVGYARAAGRVAQEHGPEWDAAYDLSDFPLLLTPAQAVALRDGLHELVQSVQQDAGGPEQPGARRVSVQIALLPADAGSRS